MPFLIAGSERYSLRVGSNTLGGSGSNAIPLAVLAGLPPAATITVRPDRTCVIERLTAGVVVTVDGESIGAEPHALGHGMRLAVGPARLLYADPSAERGSASEAPTELAPAVASADAGGRLVELRTGRRFPIPEQGLVLGRGGGADIAVEERGVSRRHALVDRSEGRRYTVTDTSANGTLLNGAPVTGACALTHGDVLRIGTAEFRFEIETALPLQDAAPPSATDIVAGVSEPEAPAARLGQTRAPRVASSSPPIAPATAPAPTLALLDVSGGADAGRQFRIERAVCAIGRGDANDVRLTDGSVSASHATLLRKRGTWYVVDLQSANGTYVDGFRVAGERALPDGGTLRIGDVVMKFRALATGSAVSNATRAPGGIWRRLSKLWQT